MSARKFAASLLNLNAANAANRARHKFGVWRCATCQSEAPATVHQLRKTYCSSACMAAGYKWRMRGHSNPNFKGAGHKVCQNCGVSFHNYQKRLYCSLRCRDESEYYVRGRARKDKNHSAIVDTIRRVGGHVLDISYLGQGMPDLVVLTRKGIQLAEIKNPANAYGKRGLTRLQRKWANEWRGSPVYVLRTDDDAINLVTGHFERLESNLNQAISAITETT